MGAHSVGGLQDQWFLTIDGLYEVLFISRKPIAKEFRKWVRSILEEIRLTGEYKNNKIHQEIGQNNQIINQFNNQPVVYLGLVEEIDQENQIVKYGYTGDIKKTSIRHKKSYGDQFNFIFATECKEHYEIEHKIQKHNDLKTRHVKTYENKERHELLRLDKNFTIKKLIELILNLKETLDKDNEIYLEELKLEKMKEETKQIELNIIQKQEETKQKQLDIILKEEETKQKQLDLEMKKLEFEMKKFNFQQNIEKSDNEISQLTSLNSKKEKINNELFLNKINISENKKDFVSLETMYSFYKEWCSIFKNNEVNLTRSELKNKVEDYIKNILKHNKWEYKHYMIKGQRIYCWLGITYINQIINKK